VDEWLQDGIKNFKFETSIRISVLKAGLAAKYHKNVSGFDFLTIDRLADEMLTVHGLELLLKFIPKTKGCANSLDLIFNHSTIALD
jgi:hypothetical protein